MTIWQLPGLTPSFVLKDHYWWGLGGSYAEPGIKL